MQQRRELAMGRIHVINGAIGNYAVGESWGLSKIPCHSQKRQFGEALDGVGHSTDMKEFRGLTCRYRHLHYRPHDPIKPARCLPHLEVHRAIKYRTDLADHSEFELFLTAVRVWPGEYLKHHQRR